MCLKPRGHFPHTRWARAVAAVAFYEHERGNQLSLHICELGIVNGTVYSLVEKQWALIKILTVLGTYVCYVWTISATSAVHRAYIPVWPGQFLGDVKLPSSSSSSSVRSPPPEMSLLSSAFFPSQVPHLSQTHRWTREREGEGREAETACSSLLSLSPPVSQQERNISSLGRSPPFPPSLPPCPKRRFFVLKQERRELVKKDSTRKNI